MTFSYSIRRRANASCTFRQGARAGRVVAVADVERGDRGRLGYLSNAEAPSRRIGAEVRRAGALGGAGAELGARVAERGVAEITSNDAGALAASLIATHDQRLDAARVARGRRRLRRRWRRRRLRVARRSRSTPSDSSSAGSGCRKPMASRTRSAGWSTRCPRWHQTAARRSLHQWMRSTSVRARELVVEMAKVALPPSLSA